MSNRQILVKYYNSPAGQITTDKEASLTGEIENFCKKYMDIDAYIALENILCKRIGIAMDRGLIDGYNMAFNA